MPKPNIGDPVTQEQIDSAINIASFQGAKPDAAKAWNQGPESGGELEGWCYNRYGYRGYPLYGGTVVNSEKVHIYYLPETDEFILLRKGEEPSKYKVSEGKKK